MKPLIYTAMSRHSYYAKEIVCAHVFNKGGVPLNPFSLFGYFLFDLVDRSLVRTANARVIHAADEVWSYGPIADGCLVEIFQALDEKKLIRFFNVGKKLSEIREIELTELEFESESLRLEFEKRFKLDGNRLIHP